MLTPLAWAAARFELGTRALRWSTTAALLISIVIVFTGGVVRVTGSGLGCPDWPLCDGASLSPSPELGIHGVIEFANRMLVPVIIGAVGWVIIAATLQRPRVVSTTRLAWSQFWLVVANAIAGGITVLEGLNPWVVALHFILAMALLATTTATWHRVHQDESVGSQQLGRQVTSLGWALAVTTAVLVAVGTLVSGSGPHSGDSSDVPRMAIDWTTITAIHGVIAVSVIVIAVVLWVRLAGADRRTRIARKRVTVFLVVILAQGFAGVLQSITGLPEALVSFHLLGAALVWAGVIRVLLDVDPLAFSSVKPGTRSLPVPVSS